MIFNNLGESINLLKKIIKDSNCTRMNLSIIRGYLGELYVIKKLQEENQSLEHKGKQFGCDIECGNYKVDVKTSSLKDDLNAGFRFWSWALKSKGKNKPIACTHFVCIAFDDNSNPIYFFIINLKYLNSFPKCFGQFNSVENGFSHYDGQVNYKNDEHKNYFETSKILLSDNKVIRINSNGSLRDALGIA